MNSDRVLMLIKAYEQSDEANKKAIESIKSPINESEVRILRDAFETILDHANQIDRGHDYPATVVIKDCARDIKMVIESVEDRMGIVPSMIKWKMVKK